MSSPDSRILQPTINCCDGWSKCGFESKDRKELRDHMRQCVYSDAGGMYRVFRGHGPNREARGT